MADAESQHSGNKTGARGGWITFPFMIITILGFAITSFGGIANLIVFLIQEFNIKSITAVQISNIINGCLSMFPVVAAVVADSFFGDITVISVSAFISLIGIVLMTLITFVNYLRPEPCEAGSILCSSPSILQLGVLYVALTLLTTGLAGTRVTLASAGANQYEKPRDQASFFNWYLITLYGGAICGTTAIVYIQDNISWKLGFGLCAAANLISFITFITTKRFYKHEKPMGSPFTSLVRVVVASTMKRKVVNSSKEEDYHTETKTSDAMPSKNFRFLNRAAIKTGDGSNNSIWRLCTVQEVEDFKTILRILPIWITILFLAVPIAAQGSMVVLQSLVMDRKLSPHFKVSAGSLQVISLISACVCTILNIWILYPLYRKITQKDLTPLQLIGISQVFCFLSMVISAIVEAKRLKIVNDEQHMSVLWLCPSLVLTGVAEAFYIPASNALFYGEFPTSLKNTAASITSIAIGVSFYLSTTYIGVIQMATAWLPNDINHGRVDNVYWVLVVGCVLNVGYFLVCSSSYIYRNVQVLNNGNDPKDVVIT